MTDQILVLSPLFEACAAFLIFFLLSSASYGTAAWLLPAGSTARRLSAAIVVGHAVQLGIFRILAHASAFRPIPAIAAVTVFAGVTALVRTFRPRCGFSLRTHFQGDLDNLGVRIRQAFASPARRLAQALAAAAAVAFIRAVINLPIVTDSLAYHMIFSGNFVRGGGWFDIDMPGVWGVKYRLYPTGGEMLAAWLMLPFHGDLLAGLTCFPAWVLTMTALYELGRSLGLAPSRAVIPACLVGFMPAVFAFVASTYVDIPLLGLLLAGTLFFLQAWQTDGRAAHVLCGMAMGTALSVKIFALGGAIGALVMLFGRALVSRRSMPVLLVTAATAVMGLPHYFDLYMRFGSPTWPLPLGLPGVPLFSGSRAFAEMLAYLAVVADRQVSNGSLPYEIGWLAKWFFGFGPVSIGPTALVGAALAPIGLWTVWTRSSRGFAAFAGLMLAASLAGLAGAGMWKFHVIFASVNARLNTFPAALLILLAVIALERWREEARTVGLAAMTGLGILGFLVSFPITWSTGFPGLDLVLMLLPVVAWCSPDIRPPPFPVIGRRLVIAGAVLLITGLSLLPALKDVLRPTQLMSAFEGYDMDRTSSPAWVYCDDPAKPRRIAFSTGWDGMLGYKWYAAYLMGRRLQNQLTYVPITRNGEIIEYNDTDKILREADFDAWCRRLSEQRVDTVVLFPPFPPEHDWVTAHPDLFVAEDIASPAMVFRFSVKGVDEK